MTFEEWAGKLINHTYPNGYKVLSIYPPKHQHIACILAPDVTEVEEVLILAHNEHKGEYVTARVYPHILPFNEWHSGDYIMSDDINDAFESVRRRGHQA